MANGPETVSQGLSNDKNVKMNSGTDSRSTKKSADVTGMDLQVI